MFALRHQSAARLTQIDRAEPAHRTRTKDDCAIEHHEEKEAMPDAGDPARAARETAGSEPPPKDIGQPPDGEKVIEKETTAPADAGHFRSLPRSLSIRGDVAPAVVKSERADDVREKENAADRPHASRFHGRVVAVPREQHSARSDRIGE